MNLPNPYFKEVVDTIADIECWLSGRAGRAARDADGALLAGFFDDHDVGYGA